MSNVVSLGVTFRDIGVYNYVSLYRMLGLGRIMDVATFGVVLFRDVYPWERGLGDGVSHDIV